MNIQNQIVEFAKKYSLREKALLSIDDVMDSCIKADQKNGIDFLKGHDRKDLIYELSNIDFRVHTNDYSRVVTRINIYSRKSYKSSHNVPVGYYEEWTDLNGNQLDEFLIFDWSPMNCCIENHIERLNKTIPHRYFKSDNSEYEFVTYINHIISLVQGQQFEIAMYFVKRCFSYLESPINIEIQEEYLGECLCLFKTIYHFVEINEVIDKDILLAYNIGERLQPKVKQEI